MADSPLWLFILVRLLSVVLIQTWFVADEFWQATEIAHYMVFGYGYQTWEWQEGIRSALYPSVLASLYKMLTCAGLEHRMLMIHVPRVFHALAFAVGDYHIWKLSGMLYSKASARWTTICLVSAWFLEYCAPRTLTSCAEMVLLSVALCYYPWRRQKECCDIGHLWIVGIACAMRPTAAVPFLPLCLQHLWLTHSKMWLLLKYLSTIVAVVIFTVGLDTLYYGRLVIVPWKFAHFNVLSGLASHYGTLPWHWYLSQGMPATLTTHHLPFVLAAVYYPKRHKELLTVCIWSVFVYSCLGHKEFRFLLPVLPLCLCIAGDYIAFTLASYSKRKDQSTRCRSVIVVIFLMIPNLVVVLYLGLVHQRGPLDTMTILQSDIDAHNESDILFLMPCHSTPYYSHLHKNISMRFLTCEPNLQQKQNYMDEADIFEQDPLTWLHQEYGQTSSLKQANTVCDTEESKGDLLDFRKHIELDNVSSGITHSLYKDLPTHLVLFDILRDRISCFIAQHQYQLCHEIFHAQITDGRRSKYILVYCK